MTWTPTGRPSAVGPVGRVTTGSNMAPMAPHQAMARGVGHVGAIDVQNPFHDGRSVSCTNAAVGMTGARTTA